jgi:hypothetical protein
VPEAPSKQHKRRGTWRSCCWPISAWHDIPCSPAAASPSHCRLLIPKADFTRRYFAAHKTMARALVAACGLGGQRAAMVLDWQKVRLIQ